MKLLLTELDLLNRGSRKTFLFAHFGIFLLCFLFSLAYILGSNVVQFVRNNLIGSLPQQELLVEVKKVEMAMFRMDAPDAARLTTESLQKMAAISGVDQVLPIQYATGPVAVEGSFLGQQFGSKMVLQGFEPAWVEDEFAAPILDWKPGDDIPVLINSQILAIYNNGFAKASGFPELSASAIVNQRFVLVVGDEKRGKTKAHAKVVGLASKVGLGVCIPNEALNYLHSGFSGPDPIPVQAVLRVHDLPSVEAVKKQVLDLGFHIVEPPALVKALVRTARIGAVFAWCGAILLMIVALSYLNQTVKMLFYLKRRDYAMCRAMGMGRRKMRSLLLAEMLMWVAFDALLAFSLSSFLSHWINKIYLNDMLLRFTGIEFVVNIPSQRLVLFAAVLLFASAVSLIPRVYFDTRRFVGHAIKTS